jgi:hypothetical protein
VEGFFTGVDTALKNFVMLGGSPITRGRKLRGYVFFCGVPHVGWKNFLESGGEVENEKEAKHVSGGAFMECADRLVRWCAGKSGVALQRSPEGPHIASLNNKHRPLKLGVSVHFLSF